jgi:hypothetical protein
MSDAAHCPQNFTSTGFSCSHGDTSSRASRPLQRPIVPPYPSRGCSTWATPPRWEASRCRQRAPDEQAAFVDGVAGRAEEPGLGLIAAGAFSAPYEDVEPKRT